MYSTILTCGTSSTEDEGTDGNSLRVLPLGVDDWALGGGAGEAGVGVGSITRHPNLPGLTQPVGHGHILMEKSHTDSDLLTTM